MAKRERNPQSAASSSDRQNLTENVWQRIREALQGLRFGLVTITVQDGVVVQIERTERQRIC